MTTRYRTTSGDSTSTSTQTSANQGVASTRTQTTVAASTEAQTGNANTGAYTLASSGATAVTKPVSGSDARGAYTGTVVSSETVSASQSGNADTGSSSSANWRSGTQTVSVAGGTGTQTYSASTVLQTSDNGTAWVVGTSGANGSANTHAATQTNSESGSAAGATYALGWTSTAGATDTASTNPADGRTTNTHSEWSTASLHETGSTDASHWYTLDKTDSKWAGSTRTGQVGGRFSATGSQGETSTAIESNAHGANTATFTEILSDTASTTASGSAAAGYYTLSEVGNRTASFVQAGLFGGRTYSVNENSHGGYSATTQGFEEVSGSTVTEAATTTDSATESVGGTNSFTLVANGVDASTTTSTANGVTGATSSWGTGSDVYTLSEWGSTGAGLYSQSVAGTDTYAESKAGNAQAQTDSGTVSGGGTWTRSTSGSGSTLASGSGTNSYAQTTTGNAIAGVFGQTLTGQTRYQLVEQFSDISNANAAATPGNVKFHPHGLAFRDPTAPNLKAETLERIHGSRYINAWVWWNKLSPTEQADFTKLTAQQQIDELYKLGPNLNKADESAFNDWQKQLRAEQEARLRGAGKPGAGKSGGSATPMDPNGKGPLGPSGEGSEPPPFKTRKDDTILPKGVELTPEQWKKLTPDEQKTVENLNKELAGTLQIKVIMVFLNSLKEPGEVVRMLRNSELFNAFSRELARQFYKEDSGPSTFSKAKDWEEFVPLLGSGKDTLYHLENGRYLRAAWNGFLFVTDVFIVKDLVLLGLKGGRYLANLSKRGAAATPKSAVGSEAAALEKAGGDLLAGEMRLATGEGGAARSFELVNSPSCFPAGVPLLTPTGSKKIEEFVVGDEILSRNEFDPTGEVASKKVEEVFQRFAPCVELLIGGRAIRTTAEHPFWVEHKGWCPVYELQVGDRLLTLSGEYLQLQGKAERDEWLVVYNLRVADWHTYFVGCDEWGFSLWAHNAEYVIAHRGSGRYGVKNKDTGEWVMEGGKVKLFSKEEATKAASEITATANASVDPRKFTDYVFKEGDPTGKGAAFRQLGYDKANSPELIKMWEQQAHAKFKAGDYKLGHKDQHGQRIDIEIVVPGIGDKAGKTSYMKSGWMIQPDGTIKLTTPFSGYTK